MSFTQVSELAYFRGVDFAAVRSGAVRTSLAHYFVNPEMEAIENGKIRWRCWVTFNTGCPNCSWTGLG